MDNNELFSSFKNILSFVSENKYSDFYRKKYQKAGFNPLSDFKSTEDIRKIPFLTREDLTEADSFELLFVPKEEVEFISSGSGTSGRKPFFIFFSMNCRYPHSSLADAVDEKDLKVLIMMNIFRVPQIFCSFRSYRNNYKETTLEFIGDVYNLPSSCQLALRLGVNLIMTTPTMAILLSDYVKKYPELEKSVKFLYLMGEVVSSAKKQLLRKLYPNVEIFFCYGLNEGVEIGFQCKYLSKNNETFFHQRLEGNYIEIINPETNEEAVLREALSRHHGNRSKVARELGIHRSTLWRKIKQYGIQNPE